MKRGFMKRGFMMQDTGYKFGDMSCIFNYLPVKIMGLRPITGSARAPASPERAYV
ncbi:MAG: hypothetical protein QMD80_05960 [archaeon]|nr:hypothetical protein [archaeon]